MLGGKTRDRFQALPKHFYQVLTLRGINRLPQTQLACVKAVDPEGLRMTMLFHIQFGKACYELLHNHQRARIINCSSQRHDAKSNLRGGLACTILAYNMLCYDNKSGTRRPVSPACTTDPRSEWRQRR